MFARELMSSPVITAHPDATIGVAARIMLDKNVGALPVVDDGGKLVGMLTRYDFGLHPRYRGMAQNLYSMMGTTASPQHIEDVSRQVGAKLVKDVMETHVFTVNVDDSVGYMTEWMLRHSIHRLPVMDEGTLVGIVTRHDFLKLIATDP